MKPIPSPPALPILGHVGTGQLDPKHMVVSFHILRQKYGEIYKLNLVGTVLIICSSQRIVNELCDESRFHKQIRGPLEILRNGGGDGLFTAYDGEENWGLAHRILMPAFGPSKILSMFDDMLDINSQLLLKWERFGPDVSFDPAQDFTRLTFDTIALCVMNYRFNSFYREDMHPFIGAMVNFLSESGFRFQRPKLIQSLMTGTNKKYEEDIKLMVQVCDDIVAHRKSHPLEGKSDLLTLMLEGKDPKTGKKLPDSNIRNQLITFLIAGHETTSGLLSFALYYLVSNPPTYAALQKEIDTVLGKEPLNVHHLSKLEYANAVLRESLRLSPTAPGFGLSCVKDSEVLAGEYEVLKDWTCVVNLHDLHRDPVVWGDDAEEFRPERMLVGKFEALPPNSWKPFGNGARACIGRPLAWQESLMMLATLFQRFDIRFDDPSYRLKVKQTLTIKPEGFRIRAIPRQGIRPLALPGSLGAAAGGAAHTNDLAWERKKQTTVSGGVPMLILFGSDSGTCESFAQQIAGDAGGHGFSPKIGSLDTVEDVKLLPRDGPVVILTSSREGQPPENAVHFVHSIENMDTTNKPLQGVRYAVFGAGNHDWARSFQRIPKLVDSRLEDLGAERLVPRGEGDAGGPDLFGAFDEWESALWSTLSKAFKTTPASPADDNEKTGDLVVTVTGTARNILLRQPDLTEGRCIENRLLTAPGAPEKRHVEFRLPEGMAYRPGDYLAILPVNPPELVRRVLTYFNLLGETKVSIRTSTPTSLPTDEPVSVKELFSEYVELGQPMTQRNLDELLRYAPKEGSERQAFDKLVANAKAEVFGKRLSLLDFLERSPSLNVPLGVFIKLLPAMRIRRYSISSSPLSKPGHCTLTFSVIRGPSPGGNGEFIGVASNYLASLKPGDGVSLAVRASAVNFHLPADSTKPIVMFCAGSGFAPMRGFIQERSEQLAAGQNVGKALLFFGCRDPEKDFIYVDSDLAEWVEAGAVDVHPAFSRHPELSEGCRYVQDRVWKDRELIRPLLLDESARFYTCGMSEMAHAVRERCVDILADSGQYDRAQSEELFDKIIQERFSTDVFG